MAIFHLANTREQVLFIAVLKDLRPKQMLSVKPLNQRTISYSSRGLKGAYKPSTN